MGKEKTSIELGANSSNANEPLILIVDSSDSYRQELEEGLSDEGFLTHVASTAEEALEKFKALHPQLVVIDIMLPRQSGIDLCLKFKELGSCPIIIVTSKDSEIDIVLGLELGASDYIVKPFRLRELIARVRAVLRRESTGRQAQVTAPIKYESLAPTTNTLCVGDFKLDTSRRELTSKGTYIELSRKEFDLLELLMSHHGQVLTRDFCIEQLWWNQDLADTRTLDTHVKRLRRKMEPDPSKPRYLITIRGVGFRFEA